jgi:rhodanese-related sulfurtransferase
MNWKRILIEAAILIAGAVLVAAAPNPFRNQAHKLAWIAGYHAAGAQSPQPASAGSSTDAAAENPGLLALAPPKDPTLLYLDISSEVAKRLHDAGALFIDARRGTVFEEGHIEHARNIPVWEHDAEERVASLHAAGIKPDQVMIVYCSGGSCEDGPRLAEMLAFAGFLNVYVYRDGYPAWLSNGWPIARGKLP